MAILPLIVKIISDTAADCRIFSFQTRVDPKGRSRYCGAHEKIDTDINHIFYDIHRTDGHCHGAIFTRQTHWPDNQSRHIGHSPHSNNNHAPPIQQPQVDHDVVYGKTV